MKKHPLKRNALHVDILFIDMIALKNIWQLIIRTKAVYIHKLDKIHTLWFEASYM